MNSIRSSKQVDLLVYFVTYLFLGGSLTKVAYVSAFSRKRPKTKTCATPDSNDQTQKVYAIMSMRRKYYSLFLHVYSIYYDILT